LIVAKETVFTDPAVATLMPVPAATEVDAVQVGTPESQPSTWPLEPPVRVRAEAEDPITEIGWESERTPEAVSVEVAVAYSRPLFPAMTPERVPFVIGLENLLLPEKVLLSERRVEEANFQVEVLKV
jgi:hypothetical protein